MDKLAVGLMSGTSLDGIDVLIAQIKGNFLDTQIIPIAFQTIPYEIALKEKLKHILLNKTVGLDVLCSLNAELSIAYSKAVIKVCKLHMIELASIDFIASHGQTLYHIDQSSNDMLSASLQLGDGSMLAQYLQTTVVSNFRNSDIAVGGKGAPLVPYADYILFRQEKKSVSVHNIGGISNLTYIKKDGHINEVIAFDTGPGVMMMDSAMSYLYHQSYDDKGKIAQSGHIIKSLLDELLSHPFIDQSPPKSTGREAFGEQVTQDILKTYQAYEKQDIMCTLTEFTAQSIMMNYQKHILSNHVLDEIILCGGGVHNLYLVSRIQSLMSPIKVKKIESYGYNSDAKEALAFIILANETLNQCTSNVKSATGANRDVVLGQVSFGKTQS